MLTCGDRLLVLRRDDIPTINWPGMWDLPGGARSGLLAASEILEGIDDIHFANLTSADVVRHRLVADIVDAYGRYDAAAERRRAEAKKRREARAGGEGQPA